MQLHFNFTTLEDRILWHVVREMHYSPDGVPVPLLVQTLSDFGPTAVERVIRELQEREGT